MLNLNVEYTGIDNVNCYLLFIDFDNKNITQKYDFILNYIKKNCNINKKLYVLGMYNNNKKEEEEDIYEQDILFQLYNSKLYFKYLGVNISDEKQVSEIIMNILLYCSKYPIYSDQEIKEKKRTLNYNYNDNYNDNKKNYVNNILDVQKKIGNTFLFYNNLLNNNDNKEECIII